MIIVHLNRCYVTAVISLLLSANDRVLLLHVWSLVQVCVCACVYAEIAIRCPCNLFPQGQLHPLMAFENSNSLM
jgi:hypothetical protein